MVYGSFKGHFVLKEWGVHRSAEKDLSEEGGDNALAVSASAKTALSLASKAKRIPEAEAVFLLDLAKAGAMEDCAWKVQTMMMEQDKENKRAQKFRTAGEAKLEIMTKLAERETGKVQKKGLKVPEIVVQLPRSQAPGF